MCGGWFASVANFKDNVIPPPNLTRLVVMNLLRTSLSRYLSRALSTLSLLLRLLLLKQTNRRISTDDVLLQAASFNGRSMAFARDPSLSTVHTSNHEIILVDVHATNQQLQTVQHACTRASFFSLANSANIRMCFIEPEARQPRSRVALSFRATRGKPLVCPASSCGWCTWSS